MGLGSGGSKATVPGAGGSAVGSKALLGGAGSKRELPGAKTEDVEEFELKSSPLTTEVRPLLDQDHVETAAGDGVPPAPPLLLPLTAARHL